MNLDPLDDVLSPLQPPVGGGHGVEHDLAALVDAQPVVGEHRVRPGVVHRVMLCYGVWRQLVIKRTFSKYPSEYCVFITVLIFEEP